MADPKAKSDPYANYAQSDPYAQYTDVPNMGSPASPPEPSLLDRIEHGHQLENFGKGILKGAGQTANAIGSVLIPDSLVRAVGATPPTQQQENSYFAPQGTSQAVGKGLEQAGEFLLPGAGEEEAVGKLAEFSPKLETTGRILAPALTSGAINKLQGAKFSTGALAGGVAGAGGELLKAAAPTLAETALKIGKRERAFGRGGRAIGKAILEDTSGVRPETIERTGRETIQQLTPQMESLVNSSPANVSLVPARQAIAEPMARAETNEAAGLHGQLSDMSDFLDTGRVSRLPIAETEPASRVLQLKRGFGDEMLRWNPETHTQAMAAGRKAYHLLGEGIHKAVPGTAELDERVSNLIPVVHRAESVSREAPFGQRIASRLGAHTGALTGAGLGSYAGYRETHTPEGAIAGGLLGLTIPEVVANPEGQMAAARTLYHAPVIAKPLLGGALQTTRGDNQ